MTRYDQAGHAPDEPIELIVVLRAIFLVEEHVEEDILVVACSSQLRKQLIEFTLVGDVDITDGETIFVVNGHQFLVVRNTDE